MNDHTIAKQLSERMLDRGVTLPQLWALVDMAGSTEPHASTTKDRRAEQQRKYGMLERLEDALGFSIIASKPAGAERSNAPAATLTNEGRDLLEIVTRFFDELHAFDQAHQRHGRSVRIASSTTLLHWLVLPAIRELQQQASEFCDPRQPEISFRQIEREDVSIGLTSHSFHYAILRQSGDIPVDFLEEELNESVIKAAARWAAWSDEEFAAWAKTDKSPFHVPNAHGHRRVGCILGQYRYEMCVRPGLWKEITTQSKKSGRNWKNNLPIALCTNHPKFSSPLLDIEHKRGFHVAVRTDTWVESAQIALHGDYATILPSIALKRLAPDLMAIDGAGSPLPDEKVMLVFNPSILRQKIFRQMLHATLVTMTAALNGK